MLRTVEQVRRPVHAVRIPSLRDADAGSADVGRGDGAIGNSGECVRNRAEEPSIAFRIEPELALACGR